MSYKKFTKDVGIIGFTQIITAVGGIITIPIITKLLGAENYGIWIQLLVTLSLISSFVVVNLPYGFLRFLPGEKDDQKIQDDVWSVFFVMMGLLALVAILLASFSGPVSTFLKCPRVFIFFLSIIIFFECLIQLFYNFLRAFQEISKFSFFVILQKIIEVALIFAAITFGYGLVGAIAGLAANRIIIFLAMGAMVVKKIGFKFPRFQRIKEYFSFCLPLIPGDASSWVIQSSDRYFIGFFLGTIFVGYYAPAYTLGSLLTFFIMPISFLLPPILSKYHDENELGKVKIYLKYSIKYFLIIALPGVFGLTVLSRQLLSVLSTPEIALHSYFVAPLVALGALLSGVSVIFSQVLFLKKKMKTNATIYIAAAILNFGLNFLLVPLLGILGAAVTTLLAYAFIAGAYYYYSLKKLQFTLELDWLSILKSIIASSIMASVIFWFNPLGWMQTITIVLTGAIIYFLVFLILKGFGAKDMALVKEILAGK